MRNAPLPKVKDVPLSAIFYALSDPARLKVVLCLLEEGEVTCGQITYDVSKSTMSHHFKVLRQAGLIQKREEGTRQYNSLRKKEIEERCPGLLEALASSRRPL